MSTDNSLKEIRSVFEVNMNSARLFVQLADLKKLRGELRSLRPIAIIRDSLGPLRQIVKDICNKTYEVGLPQTVVFIVTCFEYSLKEGYRRLKDGDLTDKENRSFLKPDAIRLLYGKIVKKDVLHGDEKLVKRIKAVIQERHIIVHRAGILDKEAYLAFEEAGLNRGTVGSKLKLSPEVVSEDIDHLKTFVSTILDHVN